MSNRTEIYFHLGLPKVASTYFQLVIFPYLEDVTFYKKHNFNLYKSLDPESLPGKHLFSSEKDKRIIDAVEDIVQRFPDAKIMLFFRRHDDWILSRYKYSIRKHRGESFKEFMDLPINSWVHDRKANYYQSIIDEISRLTKTPPLVLSHSLLRKNPTNFISQVTDFMNTSLPENQSLKPIHNSFNTKQLLVLRRWNKFYPYDHYKYSNKLLNKIHRKYREFLLHIIAFFVNILPLPGLTRRELLSAENQEFLREIMTRFDADWKYCQTYTKRSG